MAKRQWNLYGSAIFTAHPTYFILGVIWLLSNLGDRLWLSLNQSFPAWDPSNHLTNSLLYLRALQNPDIFNGDWWRQLWMLSSKYPPLTYLLGAIFQGFFGKGNDQALLTGFLYSGILLVCVHLLGKRLFNREIGLWAAGITVLLPRLYQCRVQFLLDNPLLVLVTACFTALTYWKLEKNSQKQWLWTGLFSFCFGLGLLTKQSVVFYLFFPTLVLTVTYLWQKQWLRIIQLTLSFLVSSIIWYPWYRTNWIYLFSTASNSNAIPAAMEGDPAVNTLDAWFYYAKDLPLAVSWVLLIVPVVGLLLQSLKRFPHDKNAIETRQLFLGFVWLGIFFGGTYLICSALYNKDSRYILPYLPILAIFLAYGLTRWRGRWLWVRWATIALSITITLFPSNQLSQFLNPEVFFHRPYTGQTVPNKEVFKEAITATPYQIINLGIIPNTDQINPNTLNYFGTLENHQGFGRELASNPEKIKEDSQNFQWFLSKTGENGLAQPPQLAFGETLPNDANFVSRQQWSLPDDSQLTLFQRRSPRVDVKANNVTNSLPQLTQIELPPVAPSGQPIPITYHWAGDGESLSQGLLLLTWQNVADPNQVWFHDHAIGLGELLLPPDPFLPGIEVTERTAMLPGADLPPGEYQLSAQWLDPKTQTAQALTIPPVTIRLDPSQPPSPAPPVDYVSQLFYLSQNLRQGPKGLDPIFSQVDRLNLYDPRHDYLKQADQTLTYRLSQNPANPLPLAYAQVLSRVLQENPQTAIAALQNLVELDPQNPYAHAYLAFVYLYDWQGRNGEQALQPALQLAPNSEEIQALQAIALFMQGKLIPAWQTAQPLLK